jgi:hypothetical protein
MMTVVAIVAIIIGVVQLWLRARALRAREEAFRYMVRFHAQHERAVVIAVRQGSTTAGPDELARLNQNYSDYHAAMKRKYEYGLAHPGVAIPLDPPHPVLNKPGRSVDVHYAD